MPSDTGWTAVQKMLVVMCRLAKRKTCFCGKANGHVGWLVCAQKMLAKISGGKTDE
jgi:hypothetical protein